MLMKYKKTHESLQISSTYSYSQKVGPSTPNNLQQILWLKEYFRRRDRKSVSEDEDRTSAARYYNMIICKII